MANRRWKFIGRWRHKNQEVEEKNRNEGKKKLKSETQFTLLRMQSIVTAVLEALVASVAFDSTKKNYTFHEINFQLAKF